MATWGGCYCRNPDYSPKSFIANKLVKPLSVIQMYRLLAFESKEAPHATCRKWLIETEEDWTCSA
jgi:hypothetical protein